VIYLADSDIVLTLAACGLLSDLHVILGVRRRDLRPLGALRFQLRPGKRLSRKYPQDVISRALRFLDSIGPPVDEDIPEVDEEEQRLLTLADGIDTGEALLLLATRSLPGALILTGDKRSLRALSADHSLAQVHERHVGRVVCLEQVLLAAIDTCGYSNVVAKVMPAQPYEPTLYSLFRGGHLDEGQVRDALADRIANLDGETRGLLAVM
jgi:hypothetical protein